MTEAKDSKDADSELRKFVRAFTEAAAPELRAALQGRETSEERFEAELDYQLKARNVRDIDTDD